MTKSKISILALASLGVLSFNSCKKLDQQPADSKEGNVVINEQNVRILTNGIYERLQALEYYGRDFLVLNDVGGDNVKVISGGSGRFKTEFTYTATPTGVTSQPNTWLNAYRAINQANIVISKLPSNDNTKPYQGEAYFLRALAQFDVARRYCRIPASNAGKAILDQPNSGIPIVTEVPDGPIGIKPGRATLKATYDAIISDLLKARDLAPESAAGTSKVFRGNKDAATALLSRVYLYMAKYEDVITESSKLISRYKLYEANELVAAYQKNDATPEDIFSLKFTINDNRSTNNFGYIYVPKAVGGYGDVRLQDAFVATIPASDARLAFVKNLGSNYLMKWEGNKSINMLGLADVKILRISEVLLNRAEAYAQTGKLTEAVADINALRAKRGLPEFKSNDDKAINAEIEYERSVELMGEGHRMFDIFRHNGERIVRDKDALTAAKIVADDYRAIYPIPQTEIDANPKIVQNPKYQTN
ncbi:RagB/SusD family nutrient uptake outer membrane protein [Chitinophaga nivalis]|uniref:RagB/SusD family nutrient uptake outer membrane protein n=1 Tax=Chitinophaga nivalis TaxID=2991709 RepID=A0ABT3IUC8_9BACT|nr:RagB/SusD family nutrient uptake outer membrane protein [Chitinophaga nivalis]MCW3462715.1 RagB/SusD family nutrient uptake outer membrane protein [Chitinophaga nivalis]MCW3487594.1 RagB/SusD family nutrient uptake outer membrane protein [Chitinophaga nivalis]